MLHSRSRSRPGWMRSGRGPGATLDPGQDGASPLEERERTTNLAGATGALKPLYTQQGCGNGNGLPASR